MGQNPWMGCRRPIRESTKRTKRKTSSNLIEEALANACAHKRENKVTNPTTSKIWYIHISRNPKMRNTKITFLTAQRACEVDKQNAKNK